VIQFLILSQHSAFAQSPTEEFSYGFFNSLFRKIDSTRVRKRKLSTKYLSYRIAPAQRKDYQECLTAEKNRCSLDTFSHSGFNLLISFSSFMPLKKYAELARGATFGLNAGIDYQLSSNIPLSLGINTLTMFPGRYQTKAYIPFVVLDGLNPTRFDIPIDIRIRNSMFNLHGTMKWWLPTKYVQPYIQMSGGMMYASTNVIFSIPQNSSFFNWKENDILYSKSILNNFTWSTAIAAGIGINIAYSLDLDIRATYLQSGSLKYYSAEQIKNWQFEYGNSDDNNEINSTPAGYNISPIQNLSFSVGLHVFFE
jgi:hypothetical protein